MAKEKLARVLGSRDTTVISSGRCCEKRTYNYGGFGVTYSVYLNPDGSFNDEIDVRYTIPRRTRIRVLLDYFRRMVS
ncbi:MAG: hypothetical protein HYW26_02145 [Candidatus Aenigmarchaeota archaeon]|nr:hypothetical protein [Candidatus Aenigmarchaeota archaeon]